MPERKTDLLARILVLTAAVFESAAVLLIEINPFIRVKWFAVIYP
ncbi:hypothetical protein C1O63_1159 [Dehalococcoides mccartyi]|nr:hypothetical protein C1O63_1159 [Dehalococcoides mccartyi]